MKKVLTFLFFLSFSRNLVSQVTFAMPSAACISGSVVLSANTGTLVPTQINWLASPNAIFSNSATANTSVTFTAAGTYTIMLVVISGTNLSSTQNTIQVIGNPTPSIVATSTSVCLGFAATLTAVGATNYTFVSVFPTASVLSVGVQSITASPSVPTVYQVIGESMNCIGSASISIGIAQSLNISISATSMTTCISNNSPKLSKAVILNAFGAATCSWSPGYPPGFPCNFCPPCQLTVRPHATTCYTLVGGTTVCSGSAVICITVTPQFTVAISPASASICLGQSLTLVSSSIGPGAVGSPSAFTYSWTESLIPPPISMSSNLGGTISVFPQNNATYTMDVADSQSCVSLPQQATVTVFQCTGIEENKDKSRNVQVFPNPASGLCQIICHYEIQDLEVFSATGQFVQVEVLFGMDRKTCRFNVSELSPGIYMFRLYPKEGLAKWGRFFRE